MAFYSNRIENNMKEKKKNTVFVYGAECGREKSNKSWEGRCLEIIGVQYGAILIGWSWERSKKKKQIHKFSYAIYLNISEWNEQNVEVSSGSNLTNSVFLFSHFLYSEAMQSSTESLQLNIFLLEHASHGLAMKRKILREIFILNCD